MKGGRGENRNLTVRRRKLRREKRKVQVRNCDVVWKESVRVDHERKRIWEKTVGSPKVSEKRQSRKGTPGDRQEEFTAT